jgi:hypothetical protein
MRHRLLRPRSQLWGPMGAGLSSRSIRRGHPPVERRESTSHRSMTGYAHSVSDQLPFSIEVRGKGRNKLGISLGGSMIQSHPLATESETGDATGRETVTDRETATT